MDDQQGLVHTGSSTPSFQTLSPAEIDKLDSAQPAPLDLMSNYWSPTNKGETKKVIYDRIAPYPCIDQSTGEVIELDSVFFYVKEGGNVTLMRNGSKRLVGAIQAFSLKQGTPLEIKYQGKIKNKNNSFLSDDWSVKPLVINVTP